jgi:alpha-galactosidase
MNIENDLLILTCEPEKGVFSLNKKPGGEKLFENAHLGVQFKKRGIQTKILNKDWLPFTCEQKVEAKTPHGRLRTLEFVTGGSALNLHLHITFALPEKESFLLWKIEFGNFCQEAIYLDCIEMFVLDEKNDGRLGVLESTQSDKLAFFSNGWQSWVYTATYGADEPMRQSRLGMFQDPQNQNSTTPAPRKKGLYTSDFFGVIGDRTNRKALLLGFLSQKEQFGSLQANLSKEKKVQLWAAGDEARLDPGKKMCTDWACAFPMDIDQREPFGPFITAVARENTVSEMKTKPTGWCSWYEYYQNIDDEKISRNIQAIDSMKDELPLDLVQIDDGFEAQIGDWFDFNKKFKEGVKPHADAIRAAGKIPGLWLAPFIVHRKSKLMKEHPDYILRNAVGMPVSSGFNWNSFTTSLDLSNPDSLEYACSVVRKAVEDWGFDYLKLDFLYAAALPGKHYDPSLTRAQVLRKGMEAIRKAVGPDVFLLGCGAPLGSMIGLVDAMRIGADVLGSWRTEMFGIHLILNKEPHTSSAANSIQNMLTRSILHNQWWINDPDVLLIREKMNLTLSEVQSLASMIFMTAGMVLLSDDLPKLSPQRLEIAKALIPPLDQRPVLLDWFDRQMPSKVRQDLNGSVGNWSLVSLSNWADQPRTLKLDLGALGFAEGSYWIRSFWDGETDLVDDNQPLVKKDVAAHATLVLAVRRKLDSEPQYLGSTLHLSQGLEIADWKPRFSGIDFTIQLPHTLEGKMEVWLPKIPKKASLDGKDISWERLADGRYLLAVSNKIKKAKISISY